MEILKFLAQVANICETEKFVSTKDAKASGGDTTGDKAAWDIIARHPSFTEENLAFAQTALEWIRSYDGANKYLASLRKSVAFDDVGVKQAPFVAWVIPAYIRNQEESLPSIMSANSKFQGTVDKEHAFLGTVAALRTYTRFGKQKQIVTLLDDGGNVFVYFPSNKILPLVTGDRVKVVAKVKAHNAYNGVDQTVLTRAVIRPA